MLCFLGAHLCVITEISVVNEKTFIYGYPFTVVNKYDLRLLYFRSNEKPYNLPVDFSINNL